MSAVSITFKILKNGELIKEATLTQDVIKIGRMASSHLQIDDEGISRMHAVIEVGGPDQVHVIDLGSQTGTLVNGKKVNKAPLASGDKITLGGVEVEVTFTAAAEAVAAPQAAAPAPAPAVAPRAAAVAPPAFQPRAAAPAVPAAAPAVSTAGVTAGSMFIDLNTVEDITKQAVEVVVMWNYSVLQVRHYKANEKKLRNFYVGEDFTCDFPLPAEQLQGQTKIPLVVNQPGGGCTVNIPKGFTGDVTMEDGSRTPIVDMISAGHAHASSDVPGGHALALPAKGRIKLDFDRWSFLVNAVPNPKKFVAPLQFNWTSQIYSGFSLILHAVFLFLIYFIPPDPEGLSLDLLDESNRFIKYMLNPAEVQQDEIPEWLKKDKKDEEQGGKGKRHKGEEGQMGKRDAKKTDNHYGIKGPKDNPDPHMARSMAKEMAKTAGILSYLSSANAPTSPFGRDTALGIDPENALGALMGNQVGENFGYGGLGLRGTGRGGGGTGEGTIGLGNLNTIGHGGGGGSGSGYGRGAGGLGGRRGTAPRIRSGAAMVKGSLSKEVIRRIVHRHINEVKFCYERQLAQRPDLSGRVAIKFIISGTGAVQMAAVADSTLGNAQVENCIAQAVRRWTFPQPEGGGIVIVTYPFQLTAPEG